MPYDTTVVLLRLFIALPVVLLLAYLAVRWGFGRKSTGGSGAMRVVDQLYLGPKASLLVVKVDQVYYLLSSTDRGIELIRELKSFPEVTSESKTSLALETWRRRRNSQG